MILCTTQSIEEYKSYNQKLNMSFGIGCYADETPSLFSLISIASPVLYQWESGSPVPPDDRCHGLEPYLEELYLESLSYSIGGLTLNHWLQMLDKPTEFYFNMQQFTLSGLPLLRFYEVDQLRLVMAARCYSWLKSKKSKDFGTLFCSADEKIVKENAYGKYAV